jgi:DNA-directed RNA polymerase beta' subunit
MKLMLILVSISLVGCSSPPSQYKTHRDVFEERQEQWRAEAVARKLQLDQEIQERLERANRKRAEEATTCSKLSNLPKALSFQEVTKIQELVKDQLKDPWSAYFKDIKATSARSQCSDRVWERDVVTVKGFVNSKNSYGGYGGWKNINVYLNGYVEIFG